MCSNAPYLSAEGPESVPGEPRELPVPGAAVANIDDGPAQVDPDVHHLPSALLRLAVVHGEVDRGAQPAQLDNVVGGVGRRARLREVVDGAAVGLRRQRHEGRAGVQHSSEHGPVDLEQDQVNCMYI